MPLSPTESAQNAENSRLYKDAGRRLDQLAQAGVSWSGHERNCAYLNTGTARNAGTSRFANISAVAGFDYLDDGRSLALVDWDHDGDLDVWAANRTGPRLRFLRNNAETGHHFMSVRLEGQTANRDGIGARVELTIGEHDQTKLIKTLRAGEGFLGQSTKWLHFGLGNNERVAKLVVRWPGGDVEEIADLQADRHYRIVEGQAAARLWLPPSRTVELFSSVAQEASSNDAFHVVLASRVPLPRLDYASFDGNAVELAERIGQPLLLNLWASWCRPCVDELAELTVHQQDVRDLGVRVIALSVDSLNERSPDTASLEQLRRRIGFPFEMGIAPAALVEQLQIVHDLLFKPHRALPLPTSVLLDSDGRLAAIYKGPINLDELKDDVAKLSLSGPSLLRTALPFAGRWHGAPRGQRLLPLAASLIEQKFVDETIHFVEQNRAELSRDSGFPDLLLRLGKELLSRGQTDEATARFHEALRISPNNPDGFYNLGIAMASAGRFDAAIGHYQRALQLKPDYVKAINNLGNVYLARREFDKAEQLYLRALRITPELSDVHFNLGNAYLAHRKLDQAKRHFSEAVRINPDHAPSHNNLGIICATQREMDNSIEHYRQAIKLDPDYAQAHNNLATVLASQGSLNDAVKHYRRAVQIQPKLADAHGNLGRVLAMTNQSADAVKHLRIAVQLRPDVVGPTTQLVWLLAAHPDPALRGPEDAVRLAEHAAKLTRQRDPRVLDVLAAAYASSGQFDRAVATADKAIELLLAKKQEATRLDGQVSAIRKRREIYKNGKRYRLKIGSRSRIDPESGS